MVSPESQQLVTSNPVFLLSDFLRWEVSIIDTSGEWHRHFLLLGRHLTG
jgi:hypothetical protein